MSLVNTRLFPEVRNDDANRVLRTNDDLCIRQNGNPPNGLKLLFGTNRQAWVSSLPGITITFTSDAAGKIDAMELNEMGEKSRWPKIVD